MLKTLIKRDGRSEPLDPGKVNRWAQWAMGELEGRVDWSYIVTHAISTLPETATTVELQERLIKLLREENTWAANKMAGKLYSTVINKKIHPEGHPKLQDLHRELARVGLMRPLAYSDAEYAFCDQLLQHERDFDTTYFELHQIREKYSVRNDHAGLEYETQQYVYMRMAMALAEDEPTHRRLIDLAAWYDYFSRKVINAPTPNYLNLGTPLRGYASCCLYAVDDNCKSLAVGDHIAYTMTYMSAGIGNTINIRSLGDPIRGGAIRHQGKLPYYKALAGAVKANLQNGRGGACTTYFSIYDPDAMDVIMMKNPRTTEDKKMRDIDFAMQANAFFMRKVARNEQIFTFNAHTAPDLQEALFGDGVEFERLYAEYEANPNFVKNYVFARELFVQKANQEYETGRGYRAWMDEANRHTPFKEPIRSSNLCTEIFLPTSAYQDMMDLYSTEDHGRGEVAICSLAGIVVPNVKDDEDYARAAYYALKMIDKCIHQAEYALPHIGFTAKQRLSAGVGITGLATHFARLNMKYSSIEAKHESHRLAETHMYHLINASIKLGEELGNAPWIHKTKWPEGWTPLKTYNRGIDEIADFQYERDWDDVERRLIQQGGGRFSSLASFMPTESSSKASGQPNSLYPVRFLSMIKSDENTIIDWCAPDNDIIGDQYEKAFDVPAEDLIDHYGIWQKFTDQGISADSYRRIGAGEKVKSSEMIKLGIHQVKRGLKSSYYVNTLTSKAADKVEPITVKIEGTGGGGSTGDFSPLSPRLLDVGGAMLPIVGTDLRTKEPIVEIGNTVATVPQYPADESRAGEVSEHIRESRRVTRMILGEVSAVEAVSAIDRIAAQARAQMQAARNEEEGFEYRGNDGSSCGAGGCTL